MKESLPLTRSDSTQHSDGKLSLAYIALGSNLGDRAAHMESAMEALRSLGAVGAVSSLYATEPVGTIAQPEFLNAVVELRAELQPQALLTALLEIEQENGRDRDASIPKGPRTLDLDLLSYDAEIVETPRLTLPHPALQDRFFVLVPLMEIAPEWRHPVSGKTSSELLKELTQRCDAGEGDAECRAVRRLSS